MADDALGAWLAQRQRAALEEAGRLDPPDADDAALPCSEDDGRAEPEGSELADALADDPWLQVPPAGSSAPLWAGDERPVRRSRRLMVLAAIPWVLVLLLAVPTLRRALADDGAAARPAPAQTSTTGSPAPAVPAVPAGQVGAPADGLEPAAVASGLAELAVRARWSTAAVPVPGARYVEQARAIAQRPQGTETVVVRVAALVLTAGAGGWEPPTEQLLDVAVSTDPPRLLGGPWPVTGAPPVVERDAPERVEDVTGALVAAGYDVTVEAVAELEGTGLLRATVEGSGPPPPIGTAEAGAPAPVATPGRFEVVLVAEPLAVADATTGTTPERGTP